MRLLPVWSDYGGRGVAREDTGAICRCGTYVRIREAIKRAAQTTTAQRGG